MLRTSGARETDRRTVALRRRPKVLVIDSDQLMLRTLDRTLTDEGFEVCLTETYDAAKSLIDSDLFDAALIDVGADDGRQDSLVDMLRCGPNPCCAVLMSASADGHIARRAIAKGVEDFVVKNTGSGLIVGSVQRAVLRTSTWRRRLDQVDVRGEATHLSAVPNTAADASTAAPPEDWVFRAGTRTGSTVAWPPLPTMRALDLDRCVAALSEMGGLTEGEARVLAPLLRGKQNDEIVAETGVARRTVKFHVSNILRKLRISQRSELLRFFF